MRAEGIKRSPLRVVVSGGIGSGKSTVVRMMSDLGAEVIQTDLIGHEVLEPGGPAYDAVADRWPIVVNDGRIDRAQLASIVFTDPDQLMALEALTHPHIMVELQRRVAAAGAKDVVVELPLTTDLAGDGWIRVVVDAPDEMRLQRSADRGMDRQDVANRMARQADRSQWRYGADFVIANAGTTEDLERSVTALWADLRGLA